MGYSPNRLAGVECRILAGMMRFNSSRHLEEEPGLPAGSRRSEAAAIAAYSPKLIQPSQTRLIREARERQAFNQMRSVGLLPEGQSPRQRADVGAACRCEEL